MMPACPTPAAGCTTPPATSVAGSRNSTQSRDGVTATEPGAGRTPTPTGAGCSARRTYGDLQSGRGSHLRSPPKRAPVQAVVPDFMPGKALSELPVLAGPAERPRVLSGRCGTLPEAIS